MAMKNALRLPVVSLGAEHLAIGHLMRRNILAYKAPPNNEGYDLICLHPNPNNLTKAIRVQVKNRFQTDCDRSFPVKEKTFGSFDYLIIVFLNIGYFYGKSGKDGGKQATEFFTLPRAFIEEHHYRPKSGFQKVLTKSLDLAHLRTNLGSSRSQVISRSHTPPASSSP
jgi:hypothetical protein